LSTKDEFSGAVSIYGSRLSDRLSVLTVASALLPLFATYSPSSLLRLADIVNRVGSPQNWMSCSTSTTRMCRLARRCAMCPLSSFGPSRTVSTRAPCRRRITPSRVHVVHGGSAAVCESSNEWPFNGRHLIADQQNFDSHLLKHALGQGAMDPFPW
jgi:hypothetical protein